MPSTFSSTTSVTAALAMGCDAMFDAGVRAHYYSSQLAARSMVACRRGLNVNNSFWAAQKHIGNVAYGVTVVSLYPGLVRTEKVMQAAAWLDLSNSESPEFIGRAVSALAGDPDVMRHTGAVRCLKQYEIATEDR